MALAAAPPPREYRAPLFNPYSFILCSARVRGCIRRRISAVKENNKYQNFDSPGFVKQFVREKKREGERLCEETPTGTKSIGTLRPLEKSDTVKKRKEEISSEFVCVFLKGSEVRRGRLELVKN